MKQAVLTVRIPHGNFIVSVLLFICVLQILHPALPRERFNAVCHRVLRNRFRFDGIHRTANPLRAPSQPLHRRRILPD